MWIKAVDELGKRRDVYASSYEEGESGFFFYNDKEFVAYFFGPRIVEGKRGYVKYENKLYPCTLIGVIHEDSHNTVS